MFVIEDRPEDKRRREEAAAAALWEARHRFEAVLVAAGVPREAVVAVREGIEAQGFVLRVSTGYGVLQGRMLFADYGNPNAVQHEALVLQQGWQPVEPSPDPPWLVCQDRALDGRCTDAGHDHHYSYLGLPFHRATEAEVAQLRAERT